MRTTCVALQGIQREPSPGSRYCDDAGRQDDHRLGRGLGFDLVGRGIVLPPLGCLPWTVPASALSSPDLAITRACTQTAKLTDHAAAPRVAGASPHSGGGQRRPGTLLARSRCRPYPSRRFPAGRPRASHNPRRQRRRESRDGRNRLLSHRRVSVLSQSIRSEFTRPIR